jgi:hypothetical protein
MFLHGAGQPKVLAKIGQGYVLVISFDQANSLSGITVSDQCRKVQH